jgi:hypothetical protein
MLTLSWQSAEVSIPTPLLTVPTVFKTGPEAALGNAPCVLARVEGIEPPTRGFGDRCSTTELHRHFMVRDERVELPTSSV